MHQAIPSRTALHVALRRAAHQLYDSPLVFEDPIAVPVLGKRYAEDLRRTPLRSDRKFSTALRAHVVGRSRYAEDNLASSVAAGVQQYVLLGAGLDTFAYRNPWPQLDVFEVDHPATQQWKRELLHASAIAIPENVTYVPVDFERQSLPGQLMKAGLDSAQAACFAMLGVVPYLTPAAFRSNVALVAAHSAGSSITLDYSRPRAALPFREQLAHDSLAARVKLAGEPFNLFFTPEQIAAEFSAFRSIENLGAAEINARYFSGRQDELRLLGSAGRYLCAQR